MTLYQKITLIDGTRFILRVTKESPTIVRGYEVNATVTRSCRPAHAIDCASWGEISSRAPRNCA